MGGTIQLCHYKTSFLVQNLTEEGKAQLEELEERVKLLNDLAKDYKDPGTFFIFLGGIIRQLCCCLQLALSASCFVLSRDDQAITSWVVNNHIIEHSAGADQRSCCCVSYTA